MKEVIESAKPHISEWVREKYHVIEQKQSTTGFVEAWDGDVKVGQWEEGGYMPPDIYAAWYDEFVRTDFLPKRKARMA